MTTAERRRHFVVVVATGGGTELAGCTDAQLAALREYLDTEEATAALPPVDNHWLDAVRAARTKALIEWRSRGETVREARHRIEQHIRAGIGCPACGALAKLYRRKLNSGIARICIWLVRASKAHRAQYPPRPTHPGPGLTAHQDAGALVRVGPCRGRMPEARPPVQRDLAASQVWTGRLGAVAGRIGMVSADRPGTVCGRVGYHPRRD